MAFQPINITPGAMHLATPQQSAGRWYEVDHVRWRDGRMFPIGAQQRMTQQPTGTAARLLFGWKSVNGVKNLAVGGEQNLYVIEGDTPRDITPDEFVGMEPIEGGGYGEWYYSREEYGTPRPEGSQGYRTAHGWSMDNFGDVLLTVFSRDGRLLEYNPNAVPAQDKATEVPGAPQGNIAVVVSDERHAVVLGVNGNPRRVAWSGKEDYSNWAFEDGSSLAGFLDIDSPNLLTMCAKVRDGILIWTQDEVWMLRYVGLPYVYGIERLESGCGLLSPRSFAVTPSGGCIWMGRSGFWSYEGGVVRSVPCEVSGKIYKTIDARTAAVFASGSYNGVFDEAWFIYPANESSSSKYRYVMINPSERWWSFGSIDATCMAPAGLYPNPVCANEAGHVFVMEKGQIDNAFAETGSINIAQGSRVGQDRKSVV